MPARKTLAFLMGLALIFIGVFVMFSQEKTEVRKLPLPVLDKTLKDGLLGYLKQNYKTPEEYVLSKFKDHDIIFIGEYHRIKHDVDLIDRLIPLLYKAGVYNLGIELGAYHDQDRVDNLINAATYDADAGRDIMFQFCSFWGYQEYMDIYRAAWEVNHGLPQGAPRFRVVNLNARADWSYIKTPDHGEKFQAGDRADPEPVVKDESDRHCHTYRGNEIRRQHTDAFQTIFLNFASTASAPGISTASTQAFFIV